MRGSSARALSAVATTLAILLGCCALLAAGPAAALDRDCPDFANQRDAQIYFLNRGGPESDPDDLDRDHDGVACDSNPCPCYYGSTPPGSPPSHPHVRVIHTKVRLLALAPGRALTGEQVRATVVVRPQRVRHVVLERLVRGHWRRVTSANTGSGGRHVFRIRTPAVRASYRARVTALRAGHRRFTNRTSTRRTLFVQHQLVVLDLSRRNALRGARIGLSVRVFPARAGRQVVVQRKRDGTRWVQVASGREGPRGGVVMRASAGVAGDFDYRAVVRPAAGAAQAHSANRQLTVRAPDLAPPAPRNVSGVSADGSATLTWDRVNATDLTAYHVYDVTNPALVSRVAEVTASATSTVVTGLTNDASYTFVVRAVDGGNHESADSAQVVVTPTGPAPPADPGQVQ